MNTFFCQTCQKHKDLSQRHKFNRCKACSDKIAAIKENRYKPSAAKVYTDAKINYIACKRGEL
jgi:DNA-directed RNA polymerase subunit RPC12/RpoP